MPAGSSCLSRFSSRLVGFDPQSFGDAAAILCITLRQVPDHTLLNPRIALLQVRDQVVDQLIESQERNSAFCPSGDQPKTMRKAEPR